MRVGVRRFLVGEFEDAVEAVCTIASSEQLLEGCRYDSRIQRLYSVCNCPIDTDIR